MTNWTDDQIAECNAGIDRYLNLAIEQMQVLMQAHDETEEPQRVLAIERLRARLWHVKTVKHPEYMKVHNHGLTIEEAE